MIIWMITAVWAFALTSQFENGIFQTIKNAFYLGISWLPRTLVMCVLWLVPVALLAFAPFILSRIIVLWPALFFGGTAYLCSKLMMKPLAPYFDFELPDRSGPDEEQIFSYYIIFQGSSGIRTVSSCFRRSMRLPTPHPVRS